MANFALGKDGKLYWSETALSSTSSEAALGSATEATNIQDVNGDLTKDTVEISSRANGGWKQKVGTLKDASIKFKLLYKPSDPFYGALKTSYLDDTEIAVWMLSGSKSVVGSEGISGNWMCTNISKAEPIGDTQTVDVELTPSSYTHIYVKAA